MIRVDGKEILRNLLDFGFGILIWIRLGLGLGLGGGIDLNV